MSSEDQHKDPTKIAPASSSIRGRKSVVKPRSTMRSMPPRRRATKAPENSDGTAASSAYKRAAERPPAIVQRRNARERGRVQQVNAAFDRLRRHLPHLQQRQKRVAKLKILKAAINYIYHLQDSIEDADRLAQLHYASTSKAKLTISSAYQHGSAQQQPTLSRTILPANIAAGSSNDVKPQGKRKQPRRRQIKTELTSKDNVTPKEEPNCHQQIQPAAQQVSVIVSYPGTSTSLLQHSTDSNHLPNTVYSEEVNDFHFLRQSTIDQEQQQLQQQQQLYQQEQQYLYHPHQYGIGMTPLNTNYYAGNYNTSASDFIDTQPLHELEYTRSYFPVGNSHFQTRNQRFGDAFVPATSPPQYQTSPHFYDLLSSTQVKQQMPFAVNEDFYATFNAAAQLYTRQTH